MTVTEERPQVWQARPGWGIRADLTPPETLDQRRVQGLRRRLGGALLGLLLVVGAGFVLAVLHHRAEDAALTRAQDQQTALVTQAARYRDVTSMQAVLTQLQHQVATVMAGDVDVDRLGQRLSASLPPGMKITAEAITITPADSAGGLSGSTGSTGSTGSNGSTTGSTGSTAGSAGSSDDVIGTISLTGLARHVNDVATYVQRLQAIPGVTAVVPTSTVAGAKHVTYTLAMSLTAQRLSHRYDAAGTTK